MNMEMTFYRNLPPKQMLLMLWTFKRARGSSIATILFKMVSVKFWVSFSELLGSFAQAANKQSL